MSQYFKCFYGPLVLFNVWFLLQDCQSPLYTAISKGQLDIVKRLIEGGANVNQTESVIVINS